MKPIEQLILVNEQDQEIGVAEKMEAHQKGLLHRAFSIFIFNDKNELLLQQRALEKYHSGGLWTNTCCSHPIVGETIQESIERKLFQEMGMKTKCNFAFSFIYKVQFSNDLFEHELDHVYIGFSNDKPEPNPEEVMNYKYASIEEISNLMKLHPNAFTEWFKICFQQTVNYLQAQSNTLA